MGWAMIAIGVVLALVGGVWILQGIGILLGSFMTGQSFWAAMGLLALIAGATLIVVGAQRRRRARR